MQLQSLELLCIYKVKYCVPIRWDTPAVSTLVNDNMPKTDMAKYFIILAFIFLSTATRTIVLHTEVLVNTSKSVLYVILKGLAK